MPTTVTKPYVRRARRVQASNRALSSNHAALALGVTSTIILVMTALLGFLLAHEQLAAREKLTLMLCGVLLPLALAIFARGNWETALGFVGVVCGFAAGIIGVNGIFLKLGDLGSAAGSLVVLIPLAGCGVIWAWSRRIRVLWLLLGACLAVAGVALLMSGENSAWIGLLSAILLGGYLYWRLTIDIPDWRVHLADTAVVLLCVSIFAIYAAAILAPELIVAPYSGLLSPYFQGRLFAYRDALVAIQDYAFTGSGLDSSAMVLSSYVFLLHVPYLYHVHNLLLQVAIEQGVLGLIGFIGMIIAALWSLSTTLRRSSGRFRGYAACIVVSLIALFVSGMFESDIYAGRLAFLMFLPFGFAWALSEFEVAVRTAQRPFTSRVRLRDLLIGLTPIMAVMVLVILPGAQAQLQANWGAVAQTRAELSQFRYPLWSIQDHLRRDIVDELAPAVAYYQTALRLDPGNATANRRLGQLYLSLGNYADAEVYLAAAHAAAPEQRVTRMLLGEARALQGDAAAAAALWQTVDTSQHQLEGRLAWYTQLGDATAVERIESAMMLAGQ